MSSRAFFTQGQTRRIHRSVSLRTRANNDFFFNTFWIERQDQTNVLCTWNDVFFAVSVMLTVFVIVLHSIPSYSEPM